MHAPVQGASSLDSSLTLCGFGGDYLGDCDDVSLDDVLLPDEDLLDLAPDEPTMKVGGVPSAAALFSTSLFLSCLGWESHMCRLPGGCLE